MKKLLVIAALFSVMAFPALSFSEVHIGIGIPVQIGPRYSPQYQSPYNPYPAQTQRLQGTVVQAGGNQVVIQSPNGQNQFVYLTDQTAVYGSFNVGSYV